MLLLEGVKLWLVSDSSGNYGDLPGGLKEMVDFRSCEEVVREVLEKVVAEEQLLPVVGTSSNKIKIMPDSKN